MWFYVFQLIFHLQYVRCRKQWELNLQWRLLKFMSINCWIWFQLIAIAPWYFFICNMPFFGTYIGILIHRLYGLHPTIGRAHVKSQQLEFYGIQCHFLNKMTERVQSGSNRCLILIGANTAVSCRNHYIFYARLQKNADSQDPCHFFKIHQFSHSVFSKLTDLA
jgi:hypothetical protein